MVLSSAELVHTIYGYSSATMLDDHIPSQITPVFYSNLNNSGTYLSDYPTTNEYLTVTTHHSYQPLV